MLPCTPLLPLLEHLIFSGVADTYACRSRSELQKCVQVNQGQSEGFSATQTGRSRPAGQSRAGSVINCALTLSTGKRKAVLALQSHQAGATYVQTAGLVEDRQRTGRRAATAEGCGQVGVELLQGQQATRSAPL